MCLKLWISFSFPAVSAKTSMHTEEASARVTSQRTSFVSVGGQQLSSISRQWSWEKGQEQCLSFW